MFEDIMGDGVSTVPVDKPRYMKVRSPYYDSMLLFLPAGLVSSYLERGGDYINNSESFYWYMDKYHAVDRDEIERMLKEGELEAYLDSLEYRVPEEGDGKTVDESCFSIVQTLRKEREKTDGSICIRRKACSPLFFLPSVRSLTGTEDISPVNTLKREPFIKGSR